MKDQNEEGNITIQNKYKISNKLPKWKLKGCISVNRNNLID